MLDNIAVEKSRTRNVFDATKCIRTNNKASNTDHINGILASKINIKYTRAYLLRNHLT